MTLMVAQINSSNTIIHEESSTSDHMYDAHALLQDTPSRPEPSVLLIRGMSVSALEEHCLNEITTFRRGESSQDQYGVELFRRAAAHHDPLAWESVQRCFNETLLRWMRAHPLKEVACRFESEENYVAQAFTRFWLATVAHQQVEFQTLAAALRYLQMSLNAVVCDTVRAYVRPKEVPLPESDGLWGPFAEDSDEGYELWEVIRSLLPHVREQRMAYLLFHCGLKPREIRRFCPLEFRSVGEIYRLKRNLVGRLMRHADYIRWRFDQREPE